MTTEVPATEAPPEWLWEAVHRSLPLALIACSGTHLMGYGTCQYIASGMVGEINRRAAEARAAAEQQNAALRTALLSEDEIAHAEAYYDGPLGVCAYCDREWPCRTQKAIDRALSAAAPAPARETQEGAERG